MITYKSIKKTITVNNKVYKLLINYTNADDTYYSIKIKNDNGKIIKDILTKDVFDIPIIIVKFRKEITNE